MYEIDSKISLEHPQQCNHYGTYKGYRIGNGNLCVVSHNPTHFQVISDHAPTKMPKRGIYSSTFDVSWLHTTMYMYMYKTLCAFHVQYTYNTCTGTCTCTFAVTVKT